MALKRRTTTAGYNTNKINSTEMCESECYKKKFALENGAKHSTCYQQHDIILWIESTSYDRSN